MFKGILYSTIILVFAEGAPAGTGEPFFPGFRSAHVLTHYKSSAQDKDDFSSSDRDREPVELVRLRSVWLPASFFFFLFLCCFDASMKSSSSRTYFIVAIGQDDAQYENSGHNLGLNTYPLAN
jgi:hypothetical protein